MFLGVSFTTLLVVILLGLSTATRKQSLRGNSQTLESSNTIFSRGKRDRDSSSSQINYCPVPQGHEDKCNTHDDHVICSYRGMNCEYSNMCEAKSSNGINAVDCKLKVSPQQQQQQEQSPSSGSMLFDPSCPNDNDGAPCPEVVDPVVCDVNGKKCTYSNMCKATGTNGINSSQCQSQEVSIMPLPDPNKDGVTSRPIPLPVLINPEGCPSDTKEEFCPEVMDPYVCVVNGLKCTFGNSCKANRTIGIDSSLCEKVNEIKDEDDRAIPDSNKVYDSCLGETMAFPCTREFSPIACEYKETICKFSNRCMAYSILGEQNSRKCRAIEDNLFLG